jgi:hypothetical protein
MKKYKNKPWSDAERKMLAARYFHTPIDEIMSLIPDRSMQAIRNQVSYLKKRGYRFK